jgi:hypothetical protein
VTDARVVPFLVSEVRLPPDEQELLAMTFLLLVAGWLVAAITLGPVLMEAMSFFASA